LKKLVTTNVLIPEEAGEISFDRFLTVASRANNQLISLKAGALTACNKPELQAKDCPEAQTLTLRENDPFSLKIIHSTSNEEYLLVTYLSSGWLDVINIQNSMKIHRSFNAESFLAQKITQKKRASFRIITRKTTISFKDDLTKARAYFLFEQHPKNASTLARVRAAFLVSIKVNDLINANTITESMADILNLSELFDIGGVQDLYIDETNNNVILLAREPSGFLYKIDLSKQKLMSTGSVGCMGAGSMAVSSAKNMILIPCLKDNKIAHFSLSSLRLQNVSPIYGRGPSYIVIDELHNLIYCTYYHGQFVAILDEKLKLLGRLFDKAENFRIGS
jgi:hypothetical protein